MQMSSGRGRLSGWVIAAGALLVVVGLAAWLLQSPTPTPTPSASEPSNSPTSEAPSVAGETEAPGAPDADAGALIEPEQAEWEAGAPRQVLVPSLGIAAPVLPIKTTGSTLVPPSDPQQLGWWSDGAKPGAKRGSALVTGHTVSTGGGALDDLENLETGDTVTVRTDRGRVVYAVEQVRIYSKGAVAEHAERLFSQGVRGRLVLITCEDWNGEAYLSNVVVTATPV